MPRKLMVQLLGITAGLSLSLLSYAVGLGGINVVSALGQPLKAEIELVAVSGADKPGLVARLASPDAYKGAGLEYPFGVKYSFEVGSRANGDPYLKLNSNREINDPFVSLLVELSWSSGKLMREYTFLLDPPGYVVAQPKAVAVEPLAPSVVESMPLEAAPVKREEAVQVAKPAEKAISRQAAGVAKPRLSSDEITVKSGDTLNKIAAEVKPAEISLERMLVALYRANADQFDGKNMNRIKTGKILRMPDHDEVTHLAQSDAVREIHAQSADWNSYRQKLAGAALTTTRSESNKQVATGKISAPAQDKTPLATESAKEVLRLSKGEMPGSKRAEAARAAQDKRNADAEEAIAKAQAEKEEKARAALLEANMKDMQRLAQLKAEAAALVAGAASQAAASDVAEVAAESAVAAVSEVVAASVVASEVVAASAPVAAEAESPSLLDSLQENFALLGGGAAALLALSGLGIAIKRRKQQSGKAGNPAEVEAGSSTGLLTVPVVPSPDTGDFTATGADEVALPSDEVDPISEADLFLNFGRDEQAEEVLKDALRHSPDNHEIHLKLLGIYAKHQNAAAFAEISGLLEQSGDRDAIDQADILALQLIPVDASIEDVGTATQLMDAFEIEAHDAEADVEPVIEPVVEPVAAMTEFAEPEAAPEAEPVAAETVDFDVTSTHPVPEVDFDVTASSPVVPDVLDFDIATSAPLPEEEEALPSLDDLIFDVTSTPSARTEAVASVASEPEEDGMEFTLDFPLDDVKETVAPAAPAINLSDISLDMDDVAAPAVEVSETPKSEQWHEVATKLDLARAYQEMGDEVGSREILDEVMREGDAAQQHEAELLIKQLG